MKGYLYKEFKQNRLLLVLTALASVCVAFGPIILTMTAEKSTGREVFFVFAQSGIILRLIAAAVGFLCAYTMQGFTLKGDDRKMWGYFTVSNPKGIKGYIFTKYSFIFALGVIYLALCAGCDSLFVLTAKFIGRIGIQYMAAIYLDIFFLQLLSCALEIPLTLRFGEKIGSYIKMTFFTVLTIIFLLCFFMDPEGLSEALTNFFTNGEISDIAKWVLPVVSVVGYVISYFISCKIYLKGVEQYYK